MKTPLSLLALALLILGDGLTGRAGENAPAFAYALESRAASTNRSKVGWVEFIPSCGPVEGNLRKVYRTLTIDLWSIRGVLGGVGPWSYSNYMHAFHHYYDDGSYTNNYYEHTTSSAIDPGCFYTYDYAQTSGDPGCGYGVITNDQPRIAEWYPVIDSGNYSDVDTQPTETISTNYCSVPEMARRIILRFCVASGVACSRVRSPRVCCGRAPTWS